MRRARTAAALGVTVALLGAAPAAAHDVVPSCTPTSDPLLGTVETSPNVDHLTWVAGEAFDMTSGGRRVGDYFYMTGLSHFSIYDIREPATPKLVSRVG